MTDDTPSTFDKIDEPLSEFDQRFIEDIQRRREMAPEFRLDDDINEEIESICSNCSKVGSNNHRSSSITYEADGTKFELFDQKPTDFVQPTQSFLANIWYSQLALWTFALSSVYTLLCRRRLRLAPVALSCFIVWATACLSCLMVFIVVLLHTVNHRLLKALFLPLILPLRWLGIVRNQSTYDSRSELVLSSTSVAARDGMGDGWVSPQLSYRSVSPVSVRSVNGGTCSPTVLKLPVFPDYNHDVDAPEFHLARPRSHSEHTVFWQQPAVVQHAYFGHVLQEGDLLIDREMNRNS